MSGAPTSASGACEGTGCAPGQADGAVEDMRGAPGDTGGERAGVETVSRDHAEYPRALAAMSGAPSQLHVLGGCKRLTRLLGPQLTIAIVGSERASDYGREIAASLARGLAAAQVTIIGAFGHGIAAAAHGGALEIDGPTVTVMPHGIDAVLPASRHELYERIAATGCVLALAPCGALRRRWHAIARARTVAALATATVVVEADDTPWDLGIARFAHDLGRTVAAVPGRVTSPVSRGTNALLAQGAPLVCGAADVLDLLYGLDPAAHAHPVSRPVPPPLSSRLRAILERVGAGADTPGKLSGAGEDSGETLLALSELELMGLLGRGEGERYVPRQHLPGG